MRGFPLKSRRTIMRHFTLLVHDDRYGAPNLRIAPTEDRERARQIAEQVLAETSHHTGVEVWSGERRLFVMGSEPVAGDATQAA
jgi:hypothetical protein